MQRWREGEETIEGDVKEWLSQVGRKKKQWRGGEKKEETV